MTILPFKKREPLQQGVDVHTFSVHLYQNYTTDTMTVHIEQQDRPDGTVDLEEFIDAIDRAIWHTFTDRHKMFGRMDEDLLLSARIFRSSLVSSRSQIVSKETDSGFETPAQLRWLRRRLTDLYWQIDKRRGIQYRAHQFLNDLGRLVARMKGRKNAPKSGN
jgi:hypothetical protein